MKPELCRKLDDYLLELLSNEEQAAFKQHLATCSNCQELESQTRTIEETLRSCHVSVSPSPAWQEQIQAALRKSQNGLTQANEPFVPTRKSQWDSRTSAAIAFSVLAASLLLMLRIANQPASNIPAQAITSEAIQNPAELFTPSTVQEPHRMSVYAATGFLCARVEYDDPDVEFYVVLPSTN